MEYTSLPDTSWKVDCLGALNETNHPTAIRLCWVRVFSYGRTEVQVSVALSLLYRSDPEPSHSRVRMWNSWMRTLESSSLDRIPFLLTLPELRMVA